MGPSHPGLLNAYNPQGAWLVPPEQALLAGIGPGVGPFRSTLDEVVEPRMPDQVHEAASPLMQQLERAAYLRMLKGR